MYSWIQLFHQAADSFGSLSLAPILTLTGNHSIQNESISSHKTTLSFFLSLRFSILLRVKRLINRGQSGSLRGANQQRNQIQLYKRVSRSCLVKTPHLPAPLQVNNQGPVSSTGPWHKFTSVYGTQRRGGAHSSGFHVVTLNDKLFSMISWKQCCMSTMKMLLTHRGIFFPSPSCGGTLHHYIYPQYTTWSPLTFL